MRLGLAIAAVALLGACTTTRPQITVSGCSATALAPVEAPPAIPELTEAQRQAFYRAAFQALGEAVTVSWVRAVEVSYPAWARRQAARVEAQRQECLAPR